MEELPSVLLGLISEFGSNIEIQNLRQTCRYISTAVYNFENTGLAPELIYGSAPRRASDNISRWMRRRERRRQTLIKEHLERICTALNNLPSDWKKDKYHRRQDIGKRRHLKLVKDDNIPLLEGKNLDLFMLTLQKSDVRQFAYAPRLFPWYEMTVGGGYNMIFLEKIQKDGCRKGYRFEFDEPKFRCLLFHLLPYLKEVAWK